MRKSILLLLFILACFYLSAQNSMWTNYTSTKEIICMAKNGNIIWVGTTGGLVEYNTTTLEKHCYNVSNSPIKGNRIAAVHVDSSNHVWVSNHKSGGGSEVFRFDGNVWSTFTQEDTLLAYGIHSIKQDSAGNVWFLGYEGLVKFDGVHWTGYTEADTGIPFDFVTEMDIDSSNKLWFFASSDVLYSFSEPLVQTYRLPPDIMHIYSILCDRDGKVWIAYNRVYNMMFYAEAACFDGMDWTIHHESQTHIYFDMAYYLEQDISGNIWLASSSSLAKYNGTAWHYQTLPDFAGNTYIKMLYNDDENALWLGTGYEGLFKFEEAIWSAVDISVTTIQSNEIKAIAIDHQQNAWIGTERGICHYNGTDWINDELPGNPFWGYGIKEIAADNLNNVWAVTYGNVFKYDGTSWSMCNVQFVPSPANLQLFCVETDLTNNVWIGFYGGLAKYDWQNWSFYNHNNSPVPSWVIDLMCVDSNNSLWLNFGNELAKFNGSSWIFYDPNNSVLPTSNIKALGSDDLGNVWASCRGYVNGVLEVCLVRTDGTNWTVFEQENGDIPYDYITAITKDHLGNMWFGTSQGVMKYTGSEWLVYNLNNSLENNEAITNLTCDAQNMIWIGTRFSGVYVLDSSYSHTENIITPDTYVRIYPNPIRDIAKISFELMKQEKTSINVYNLKGQKVTCIADNTLAKGKHEYTWDGCNEQGNKVSNGVYFIRITNNNVSRITKCLLLK